MQYDVFISYSRKDELVVNEIRKLFDSNSISYWLDKERVHMGGAFMEDIADAIEHSKIILFVSSHDSNNSIYTAKEVAFAFNSGKYIIPYRIDNSSFSKKLRFVMTDLNCIEAVPYTIEKAELLVEDIKSLLHGNRRKEVIEKPKREFIDVSLWNEPGNPVLRYIKRMFEDR